MCIYIYIIIQRLTMAHHETMFHRNAMDTLPGTLTFPRSRATSWCSAVPVNRGMCPPSINTFLPSYIYSMGTDNYLQMLGYAYLYISIIYRWFTYQKHVTFLRVMLVYWLVPQASPLLQHFHAPKRCPETSLNMIRYRKSKGMQNASETRSHPQYRHMMGS